ncbi:MAG: hypothetical protein KF725_05455 [Cyclobacteriaceae bacterium]|nr:hypothetical protein [Cyclobacteriaceae bacterium]UYN85921.1 MAG: hypothetical protein KIT51_13735 [Cyclobacteriaceae bacterium]
MSIFSEYHLEFLKALIKHGVKFLIIGGQAAIYYGVRRNTGDLDILVEPTRKNGEKLLLAFQEMKLVVEDVKPEEFEQQLFLGLGFEPDAVDILSMTPGVNFDSAFRQSSVIEDSHVKLHIISLDDLIKNKEALNREGEKKLLDQYDVAVLRKINQQQK